MRILKKIFFIVCVLKSFILSGQSIPGIGLDNMQNPTLHSLYKIETENFKIIFPKGLEQQGMRIANTLESVAPHVCKTSAKTRKLNVLVQNKLSETNGFATLVPRRVEYFCLPPQGDFAGTNDWFSLLSTHEFRHITQFQRLTQGWSNIANILYGSGANTILQFLRIPGWFFEGDAVVSETALTESGRGRMPQFNAEQRLLLMNDKMYSYNKMIHGSYKDWYPLDVNYSLGYLLVSDIRTKYGVAKLDSIIELSKWRSFARSMKKNTGLRTWRYVKDAQMRWKEDWTKQYANTSETFTNYLTKADKKAWTYNNFPKMLKDGSIVVFRWGQEHMYQFVRIFPDSEKEEILYESYSLQNDAPFSTNGEYLCWNENIPDLRWGYNSYNVLKTMDLQTKEIKTITHKSRLIAPAISPNGNTIAAIEFTENMECSIVFLDANTGSVLKKIPSPENNYLQTPSWSPDGSFLVMTQMHKPDGKSLVTYTPESDKWNNILNKDNINYAYPVTDGKLIYVQAPYSGIDNIYSIDITTKSIKQISSRKYGAYYPSLNPTNGNILFSDLCLQGYMAAELQVKQFSNLSLDELKPIKNSIPELLTKQEYGKSVLKDITNKEYEVKRYFGNYFPKLYGWYLTGLFPSSLGLSASQNINFQIQAQNLNNTLAIQYDYKHNIPRKSTFKSISLSYAKLYPIIDFSYGIGNESAYRIMNEEDTIMYYNWSEKSITGRIRLPLVLSRGKYSSHLYLGVEGSSIHRSDWNGDWKMSDYQDTISGLYFESFTGDYVPITYSLSYSRLTSWLRDVKPSGVRFSAEYTHTPLGDYSTSLFETNAQYLLPVNKNHHNFSIELDYSKQNSKNFWLYGSFANSRGYENISMSNMLRISGNYSLPLANIDWNLHEFLYFKRIESNLFVDYAMAGYKDLSNYSFRSLGFELSIETYFLKIPVPANLGIRANLNFDKEYQLKYWKDLPLELFLSM